MAGDRNTNIGDIVNLMAPNIPCFDPDVVIIPEPQMMIGGGGIPGACLDGIFTPGFPNGRNRKSPDGKGAASFEEIGLLLGCVCQCETCGCQPCPACVPGGSYGSYPDVNGPATGPFAIHEPFWRDGSYEGTKPAGKYKDCEGYNYSLEVVKNYWKRYGTGYSQECLARIHNGGPKACSNKYPGGSTATDAYWTKIKDCLGKKLSVSELPELPSIP